MVRCLAWMFVLVLAAPLSSLSAQDLVVDGTSVEMGGTHRFDRVRVINGGVIRVRPFDGVDREGTGNLVLIAPDIVVDATSRIDGRGAGYSTVRCGDGVGPTGAAGGAGGCSVFDSGGGGAHFGRGGRGTIDCFICGSATSCQFPQEFEADCGNTLNAGGTACSSRTACRGASCATYTGEPSTAGQAFRHSIYETEFGASGGDKGCRDGDGFSSQPAVGGAGGGRVVLVALTDTETGTLRVDGTVSAAGRRGCGTGNDSGGGGAGGSILLIGDRVDVGESAVVTASGGLGGDTLAGAVGQPDQADCVGAQSSGTCDDCGGGGGGGIINVLSRRAELASGATFDVAGAEGGVCPICRGEAGGGAGELLIDGAYVGELCDGYDNDFDGVVDEDLAGVTCGLGACATSLAACSGGEPVACTPTTTEPSCFGAADGARPRVAVVLDTSSSMLLDLRGFPTFGDGSVERPGLDTDGNGSADDSRLFLARTALAEVISAYPEIDFALARYHQDQGLARSCQLAKWFECAGLIGTYDDPRDNEGPVACSVPTSATTTIEVRERSVGGDECINYAGTCGPPRRGADILSGFGTATRDLVRWLDGRESDFRASALAGDVCEHASGGDCEVRASGETPLAGSLEAVEDYVVPIRSTDPATACRGYSVILVTDGAESCGGDPVARAQRLHDVFGIEVYVVAVSVLPEEETSLNQIAQAGSGGARTSAIFVRSPGDLVPALTSIVAGSLRTERCNAMDDDCDGLVDEGFAIGLACDDGGVGDCRGSGTTRCAPDELSVRCDLTMPGGTPSAEECNGRDDDCDEAIDEALVCTGECTPSGPEVCNGIDDDCNGLVDEVDPALGTPCGDGEGVCEPGSIRCVAGALECIGGVPARDEVCNGLDDDCDGEADELAPCPEGTLCIEGACRRRCDPAQEFPCPVGFVCSASDVPGDDASYCTPTACASCAPGERCVDERCVDPCEGVSCDEGAECRNGRCIDCRTTGCPSGELCAMRTCREDRCADAACASTEACYDGECRRACGAGDCPSGERCAASGSCEPDPCATTRCDDDEVCVDGSCRDDACRGVGCEVGQVCAAEVGCIDDPCVTVRCPSGRVCEVAADGRAECRSTAPPRDDAGPDLVAASGGGGCAAGGGGTRGIFFALLLAVVVTRRKR